MSEENKLLELANVATGVACPQWAYRAPGDHLSSGHIQAGNGPIVAVVQWPVPTADHMLAGVDASAPIGRFIAACSPETVKALVEGKWDLLEALKELDAVLGGTPMPDCGTMNRLIAASSKARAAIAKAEGRS